MSTTPRTDAAVRLTIGAGFNMVYPSFARELENELAEMSSIAEKWEDDALRYARNAEYWQTRAEKAEAELAAEREKVRVLRDALERRHTEQGYHRQYVDDALDATEDASK